MDPKKILVIDDDQNYLDTVAAMLQEAGYKVQACSKPEQGLAAVRTFQPHCLIMDLRMPIITGEKLLPWVRCQAPSLPVIVCTANEYDPVLLSNYGVRFILRKPFSEEILFESLEQAMARPRRAA